MDMLTLRPAPSVSPFSMSLTGPLNTQLYGLRRMNKPPQTQLLFFQNFVVGERKRARQIPFKLSICLANRRPVDSSLNSPSHPVVVKSFAL